MRYLLYFLLAFNCLASFAQSNGYTQQTLGTRDGMLSPKIYSLLQDADNYLWIGSEIGVSRYNGYEFDNLQYTADNKQIGKILCIAQDSLMGIWLGGDKGLFYYQNDTLSQVMIAGRTDMAVESLVVEADGDLWIGELNFLYRLSAKSVAMQTKHLNASIQLSPFITREFRAISLAIDLQNNIYATGYEGVYKINKAKHSLDTLWKNPNPHNEAVSVAAISSDSLLFNCIGGPITALSRGSAYELKNKELLGSKVFRKDKNLYALSSKTLEQYNSGQLKNIFQFGQFTNYVTASLIDKENNIWIGSWEGLLKFSKTAFNLCQLPNTKHQDFFSLLENQQKQILIGANGGQIYTDKNKTLEEFHSLPKPFTRSEINCIYQHKDGSYWFGSGYQGITQIKNGHVTNWNEQTNLPDNNCEAFYKTKDNRLFACTEKGVLTIFPDSPQPIGPNYYFQKKHTRNPKLMGCIELDGEYFFYGNQGLFRLIKNELVNDSIYSFKIKYLNINSIVKDSKGFVWIGTQGKGLLKCSFNGKNIHLEKQYGKQDGLASDIILSVLIDKNDNVWVSNYTGISLLSNNVQNNRITNFSRHDGLLSSYYQHLKLTQQKDGTIWGLSSMGLFNFHPDSINTNQVQPTVFITAAVLNKTNNNGETHSENININNSISFPYNQNSVRFLFTAISLTDPEQIHYSYRLTGFDKTWTETKNREASFNFLPPGNYTFELLASNNSNVWTTMPVRYSFDIRPPFWKTWWFQIAASLMVAILIVLIFRRRISIIKKAADIKQQMAELEAKALRAQMNPHFIFNSLNAIQECIITEKVDAAYEYLSKFSRLLRLVLNNSEKEFITLSSEIEMTRLYLSLESLRFRQSFVYELLIDENLDTDFIQIPSMIIQPFIENALWHGLRNKIGEKKLFIRYKEQDLHLLIEIEDNGVGREKAALIKKQKIGSEQFNSKGSVLSQQRLDILNRQYPMMAKINIVDLSDLNGDSIGTKVSIELPLELQKQTPD